MQTKMLKVGNEDTETRYYISSKTPNTIRRQQGSLLPLLLLLKIFDCLLLPLLLLRGTGSNFTDLDLALLRENEIKPLNI